MAAVPFFSNTPDDTHCFQASFKMILKHFEPDNDYSWEELDKITHKPAGLWTWPMAGLTWFAKNGYDVVDIEPFDYESFVAKGPAYMQELWGKEVVDIQVKYSDITMAQADAEEFIKAIRINNATPEISEIRSYLKEGYLVICSVNSSKLNMEEGFMGHAVLVIDADENSLFIHDPGLPALENRQVSDSLFEQAWADPNDSAKNLAAIKRK